jgi:hypothetical protein
VADVRSLESFLGPEQPEAVVAIEACREAWYVHDLLTSWGNQVVLVDTTRSRRLGSVNTDVRPTASTLRCWLLLSSAEGFRLRMCCRLIDVSCVADWVCDEHWLNRARKW